MATRFEQLVAVLREWGMLIYSAIFYVLYYETFQGNNLLTWKADVFTQKYKAVWAFSVVKRWCTCKKKCYSGLLIKYDVTLAVLLSSVTFTHCTKLLLFLWPFLIVMITLLGSELGVF